MTTSPANDHPGQLDRPGPEADADELNADITATRERLTESVEALSEKLDVKAQAQHAAHQIRHQSGDGLAVLGAAATWASSVAADGQGRPRLWVVAAGLLTLAVPVVVVRQRRRGRAKAQSQRPRAGRKPGIRQVSNASTP
ncbi:DUF3618 domain-containing protein [Microlunatus soli]|uniref:DUF3618 domain-containing protein n=1 Tax=Microlunatus soli TaxID=630515 RepID=A0A1H1N6V5_9ACTN|nr:Protein of unknown function [Microlunatus soli]